MKIQRRTSRAEVPTMAMGDIAFNLIIFFVILAKVQDDSHLQWEPSKVPEVERGRFPKASVLIDHKNDIYLNGQKVNMSELSSGIEASLQGVEGKDRVVQFKFHRTAPVRIIEPAFEAIGKAGADALMIFEKD